MTHAEMKARVEFLSSQGRYGEAADVYSSFKEQETSEPAPAPLLSVSDQEAEVQGLVRAGLTREDAYRELALNPKETREKYADDIQRRRDEIKRQDSENREREFADSEEGRRLAAAALIDAERALEADDELATAYLRQAEVVPVDDIPKLTREERIDLAGIRGGAPSEGPRVVVGESGQQIVNGPRGNKLEGAALEALLKEGDVL